MIETEEQFLARRPQRLCKMCGKCCRVVTASISHSELLTIAGISRTVPLSPELTLRIFETSDENLFLTYSFKSVKYHKINLFHKY